MKKQILFLITLLLAITPACTKRQKMATANGAIAAGTFFTTAGVSTTIAGGIIAASGATMELAAVAGIVMITAALPITLFIGLPLLITGVICRKKLKKQQTHQYTPSEISEEIQEYTPIDEFSLERIGS